MHEFDNYNRFLPLPAVGPFGSIYVYATMRQLIDNISYVTAIAT